MQTGSNPSVTSITGLMMPGTVFNGRYSNDNDFDVSDTLSYPPPLPSPPSPTSLLTSIADSLIPLFLLSPVRFRSSITMSARERLHTLTRLSLPSHLTLHHTTTTHSSSLVLWTNQGIAYQLNASVTLPQNSTGQQVTTNTINLFNQPPCEAGTCTWDNPYNGGIPQLNSGLAYFLIQPSSYGLYTAGNCGAPSKMGVKSMNFGYTASPRLDPSYYLTAAAKPSGNTCTGSASPRMCPLWSACVSATLQAIGPFAYPGLTAGTNDTAYTITGATGTRTYADVSGATGSVSITGVSVADGGDFTLYTTVPYFDDAGLSFSTSAPPQNPRTDINSNSLLQPVVTSGGRLQCRTDGGRGAGPRLSGQRGSDPVECGGARPTRVRRRIPHHSWSR